MATSLRIPLPPHLDSKSRFRNSFALDVANDTCLGSYNNSPSFAVAKLSDKHHTRIDLDAGQKISTFSFDYPQLVAVTNDKEGSQYLHVVNVVHSKKLLSLNLTTAVKETILFTLTLDTTSYILISDNGVWKCEVNGQTPRKIIAKKPPANCVKSLCKLVNNMVRNINFHPG